MKVLLLPELSQTLKGTHKTFQKVAPLLLKSLYLKIYGAC